MIAILAIYADAPIQNFMPFVPFVVKIKLLFNLSNLA